MPPASTQFSWGARLNAPPRMPQLGRQGERAALKWLKEQGFIPLARNLRCTLGEIDLVVYKRELLVFVEVKTRASAGFGTGLEAIDRRKQRHLARLADFWLATRFNRFSNVRFDAVIVTPKRLNSLLPLGRRFEFQHVENILEP